MITPPGLRSVVVFKRAASTAIRSDFAIHLLRLVFKYLISRDLRHFIHLFAAQMVLDTISIFLMESDGFGKVFHDVHWPSAKLH